MWGNAPPPEGTDKRLAESKLAAMLTRVLHAPPAPPGGQGFGILYKGTRGWMEVRRGRDRADRCECGYPALAQVRNE